MNTHSRLSTFSTALAIACFAFVSLAAAAPLTSAFTYQGHLVNGGVPANGAYDLRFALFSNETAGTPCGWPITNNAVPVSNGLFTTILDFGTNVFAGAGCWLEIAVHPGGIPGEFVTLSPRQLLTPTPYSIYTLKAEALAGPVPDSQLSTNVARLNSTQAFTAPVTFTTINVQGAVRATEFSGNGSGLSNVTATALSSAAVQKLWRTPISFVTVTNSGNAPDANGIGSVPYNFRIGKFEINNSQYASFLNAVAADDPKGLYSTNMTSDAHGGIIRSGSPGDYSYASKPGREHQPVVWVDFRDAIRFCNWLHNGQPVGHEDSSTTEDGAYTITTEALLANTIARNPGARFFLPSDDEWYKAAYYQPFEDGGDASNYWLYPTRSNDTPFAEPPPGGANSINARFDVGSSATDVGAYINASSYYGTYDQGGNVQEWTEGIVFVMNRRIRGGSWNYNEFYAKSTDFEFDTIDYDAAGIGFRVAATGE